MKKVFRALTAEVVEKQWIDGDTPDGWFETVSGALDAWKPDVPVDASEDVSPIQKRRGRPPKVR